jgi:DNA-binding transcriptional ArsR family regulator
MKRIVKNQLPATDLFAGEVTIHPSICYDFVVSLRALLNPRTFKRSRRWAAEQMPKLDDEIAAKAKFLFEGFDTALGYGAARVIAGLPDDAGPNELIDAVAGLPAPELAMYMLDTGETSVERLAMYRSVLEGSGPAVAEAVKGLPSGWATRCRKVLKDPETVQQDLIEVLEAHRDQIFAEHLGVVTELVQDATATAHDMLRVLPAAAVIEHLAGGYTLSADLDLRKVVLAPSTFIYPYMSARVDEDAGEALVMFGVPNHIFSNYEPVPMRDDLLGALKALSDPNRLTIMRLLADKPMYTSEFVAQLKLGQPTVHHHLTQLRTAGLVRQERDRQGMKYSIRRQVASDLLRSLEEWLLGTDEPTPGPDVARSKAQQPDFLG